MAEAFLRHYTGDQFEAFSAGLEPVKINPLTDSVMEEIGIPLTGHYAKHIREYMGKTYFGYLITVCSDADKNCPATFPDISHRLHWSFDDPAAFDGTEEERIQEFRSIRDQIKERILTWLSELDINR